MGALQGEYREEGRFWGQSIICRPVFRGVDEVHKQSANGARKAGVKRALEPGDSGNLSPEGPIPSRDEKGTKVNQSVLMNRWGKRQRALFNHSGLDTTLSLVPVISGNLDTAE